MDWIDREYIEIASVSVGGLFESQGYDAPIIYSDDQKYIDPLEFEAYIRSIPAQLWAPEFRNALDTIKHNAIRLKDNADAIIISYGQQISIKDALSMADTSLRILARTYCPEILAELESQQPDSDRPRSSAEETDQGAECSSAERPALPGGIKDTPGARAAFDCLVAAGYLDSVYKPTASANANVICAYMAISLHKLLGVRRGAWQKCFADFWGVPNLSQSLNQLDWHGKQYVADIDKALTIAAQSCDQLAETQYGKELLSNRK